MQELETIGSQFSVATASELPKAVLAAGAQGKFAWEEYFSGQIRNSHTRAAYLHAVKSFLAWIEPQEPNLASITPGMVGRYFDQLHSLSAPSKKLHMSGIRGFFDCLVLRHVCMLNPALSVRTERHSATEGKTPEITSEQARILLRSIASDSLVDIRDRAILSTLIYTAARAGAIAKLRIKDFVNEGNQYALKFREKGGKHRSIPVRHDLEANLVAYLELVGVETDAKDSPLFRTMCRRGGYSETPINGVDICRMVKRRLKAAGLPSIISPHSFRSLAATDLLLQGVALEDVQYLLGHSDSRVTMLYDRRQRRVTRNIVERISV
jgi:integrase/recombinase XerD